MYTTQITDYLKLSALQKKNELFLLIISLLSSGFKNETI
jgi:hypothetical protein